MFRPDPGVSSSSRFVLPETTGHGMRWCRLLPCRGLRDAAVDGERGLEAGGVS
jgi:hypothetical protein